MSKLLYTYEYSTDYEPPMPVAKVGISKPGRTEAKVLVTALIDSGSDGTLMPLDILESADAKYVGDAYIRGILGHRQAVELYLATLHLAGHQIHAVRIAGVDPDDEIILGRDVVNQLEMTLNGPAEMTEIPAH